MRTSPWIPLLGGLALVVLGCCCIVFVPETLRTVENRMEECQPGATSIISSCKHHLTRAVSEFKDCMAIFNSYSTVALLVTFAVQGFSDRASGITVQYFSKRFDWSIPDAGILFSAANAVNIILHLVILPLCSHILVSPRFRLRYRPETKDLFLARISAVLLVVGSLLLAWPSFGAAVCGLIVFVMGSGFQSLCRALVTTLVDAEHTARLYTLIGVVQAGSSLSSGPVIAWLFGQGLHMGGYWVGLPYLGVAILCCVGAFAVFIARMPRRK